MVFIHGGYEVIFGNALKSLKLDMLSQYVNEIDFVNIKAAAVKPAAQVGMVQDVDLQAKTQEEQFIIEAV